MKNRPNIRNTAFKLFDEGDNVMLAKDKLQRMYPFRVAQYGYILKLHTEWQKQKEEDGWLKEVKIDGADFHTVYAALAFANQVLNEEGARFDRMDQNPYGIRDLVGSAYRIVERASKKGKS